LALVLPRAKIHELFQLNVDKIVNEFQDKVRAAPPPLVNKSVCKEELKLIPDPQFRRLAATINMNKALELYNIYTYAKFIINNVGVYFTIIKNFRSDCFDEDTRLQRCSLQLKLKLEALNDVVFNEVQGHLIAAVDNCVAGIKYFRVQPDGPRLTTVSITNPLVPR